MLEFYSQLIEIMEDFCDFKKQIKLNDFDIYFKLIAKEIIFIIKVPSLSYFEKAMSKERVTTIKVEFYMIKKKMIKLSIRLKEHRIFKFLTFSSEMPKKTIT